MIKKIFNLFRNIIRRETRPGELQTGIIIHGSRENVSYGSNVSFGGNVVVMASDKVEIGSDTMISYGTKILTSTHNPENHPMWLERVDRPVRIGNHVWIGSDALILPGVIVGDYSIVAAGSVVAAHVPEGAVVAGAPARVRRYRNLSKMKTMGEPRLQYPGEVKKEGFLPESKVCKASR